ncbi:diguanylate cyclase GGDEF domain protein [Asticcacaulis biprosthecium C19]|uniref:Diguanylate cyclase GGDEF domain protein n=1 Tax=Asticcacaulis biprosthecium C19 TaxID=715226 RepID=F4QLC6_9CAUL|nr:EAL domain-containing protein [Asticcacaulis biprosthecium]EGF92271.1 diguanylate cyclase GGDEF domain protein [Asticcacaulis biprosthecium C19]
MLKLPGWRIEPRARTLFALVAVGCVGFAIAIIALMYSSLAVVIDKANQIYEARSIEYVQGAISTSIKRMTARVDDNTIWDDAVAHVYPATRDDDWLYATWGAVAMDGRDYDGVYVLNEDFKVLSAYASGQNVDSAAVVFGDGFDALITRNSQRLRSGQSAVSGLTRTRDGIAIIGVGLVRATDGTLAGQGSAKRYLVMTRHLSPLMLTDLSETFRIDDIRLTEMSDAIEPYLQLNDANGRGVGRLSWTPRQPGGEAAKAVQTHILMIALLIGGLILLLFALAGYSLLRLSRGEQVARTFALTDNLSGLPNRRALFEQLQRVDSKRGAAHKAVVFIDLDGFKDINDIYGHATGDKLIMIAAAALKEFLPNHGSLARMGGDEFALLLGGKDADARCQIFAEKALDFLTKPIRIGERIVQIGASIGIASGDLKTVRSQELFRRADLAMYHSKSSGKGRITWYDDELDAQRTRKQAIETGIREGLKRGEFDVVYQPIIEARHGTIASVEALVRWPRRPEGELVPDQFIALAESSGLIQALGQFVLRRACQEMGDFPNVRLSVNISPAQFRDVAFESKVADILAETGFPAQRLELEVTEGNLIENPERAIAAVAALKALGVTIALDDFGTGYSSIGYLRRYDFDKIKIDKSLASQVDRDPQAAALVAGTVNIANALGLAVTAEGVETEDHVRLLRLAGCQYLQGYYFSRPKPLHDVLGLPAEKAAVRA